MTQREFAAGVLFWFGGGGDWQRLAWAKRYRAETGRESPAVFEAWDDASGAMVRNKGSTRAVDWGDFQRWVDAGRSRLMDEARRILAEVAP